MADGAMWRKWMLATDDSKENDSMILICYDGSEDAKAAIGLGGELLSGQPAIVLTVWEPFARVLARSPSGFGLAAGVADDTEKIDAGAREQAHERAAEGAELARKAGFDA